MMEATAGRARPGALVQDASGILSENRLVLAHIYTATAAIVVGALFGVLQGASRANWLVLAPPLDYYKVLTAHGVLMALVFTTFFITGLFTFATYRTIPRARSLSLAWSGYAVMLIGTLMAAVTILIGDASVMYTFYAPLKASPTFYIGATLLVAGTWFVAADVFMNVAAFKKANPGEMIPLPAFMAATTFAMWVIATIGVTIEMLMLIPWSLGWTPGVDVMVTRLLFWYFGHPLVYFWIMGAYLIWYAVVPETYGGKIFSDGITRLAFIALLLLSTPVGVHHQFLEPGISKTWKFLHTINTYGVALPSLMTAFAIFASFELWAQKQGRKGFWATVRALPWNNPTFSGAGLGMLLFILGGMGGMVNASYSLDVLVHNTMWIVGHFHVTVGGPVALTFLGAAYTLVPTLTGKKLWAPALALWQTRVYFIGMLLMSFAMHFAGILGAPRRTSDVSYFGYEGAASWHPEMVLAGVGGVILFISILMFAVVAVGSYLSKERGDTTFAFAVADDRSVKLPILDKIWTWSLVAIALAVFAYAGPVADQLSQQHYLSPGLRTW